MEHPAYNTWTKREILAMPEVRWVVAKLLCTSALFLVIAAVYMATSACVMLSIPLFEARQQQMHDELWQTKTKCNEPSSTHTVAFNCQNEFGLEMLRSKAMCDTDPHRLVMFDCNQNFTVWQDGHLQIIVTDTISQLTEKHELVRFILSDTLDCLDRTGRCNSWVMAIIEAVMDNRMLVFCVSWLSSTLMLCTAVCSRGPCRYGKRLASQFRQDSAEGVRMQGMTEKQRMTLYATLVSPDNEETDTKPYKLWTPQIAVVTPPTIASEDGEPGRDGLRQRPTPRTCI